MSFPVSSMGNRAYTTGFSHAGSVVPNRPMTMSDIRPGLVMPKPSENGRFDWSEARKNFIGGLLSPVMLAIKSPLKVLGGIALVAGASAIFPPLLPILTVVGLTTTAWNIGKGLFNLATAKDGDEREKAFFDLGAGTGDLLLTGLTKKIQGVPWKEVASSCVKDVVTSFRNMGSVFSSSKQAVSLMFTKPMEAVSRFWTASANKLHTVAEDFRHLIKPSQPVVSGIPKPLQTGVAAVNAVKHEGNETLVDLSVDDLTHDPTLVHLRPLMARQPV